MISCLRRHVEKNHNNSLILVLYLAISYSVVVESIKPADDTNLISESHQTCSASNGESAAHPDQGASILHNSTEQTEYFTNTHDDSHKSSHTSNNADRSQVLESSNDRDRSQVLESSHQDISETGSDVDLFADDEDEDMSCVIEDDVTDFEEDDEEEGEGFTALKGKAVCQSTQLRNPEASMCRLVLLTIVMRIDPKQGCQFNQSLNHIDDMRANSYIDIKWNPCIRT